MITCDICGKEFKDTQGLHGHKFLAHFETKDADQRQVAQPTTQHPLSDKSEARPVAQDRLSKLEERLSRLDQATGVREPSELEKRRGYTFRPFVLSFLSPEQQWVIQLQ